MRSLLPVLLSLALSLLPPGARPAAGAPAVAVDAPRVVDPRLRLALFAESPDIVTPVGIAVERSGRVLCVESHTHFPPKDYAGPKTDRIRAFEDTDGDGRADRITNYFDGLTHTMNLAVAPDGAVFVATRSEILRLRDVDGDGRAEQRTSIARLETAGNYPHNGLSGFAFDSSGDVLFGFGENLGADYRLIGADGTTLHGGGEGGNVYRCGPGGEKLRRVATGFWNPFHLCFRDQDLFVVDNDPDSRPPCRLLHVVQDGDYGYRFRNGRRGTHPFTAWNGELPGTLPMTAGTGEAPSGILDGLQARLPREYWDQLLVTSWGDHRIECYRPEPRGASFHAVMRPLVVGGDNFRPVGIAAAADGSLFISDWVDKSYQLHGRGRIWKLHAPDERPVDAVEGRAAREQFAADRRATRSQQLAAALPFAAPAAGGAAAAAGAAPVTGAPDAGSALFESLGAVDPFVRHEARRRLVERRSIPADFVLAAGKTPRQRVELAVLLRQLHPEAGESLATTFLRDPDPAVRFVGVQWIGEQRLVSLRGELAATLAERADTKSLFEACLASLELLDAFQNKTQRKPTDEWRGEQYVARVLADESAGAGVVRRALRMLRPDHADLTLARLDKWIASPDAALRLEAIRTLRATPHDGRFERLRAIVEDAGRAGGERLEATVGLAGDPASRGLLERLAGAENMPPVGKSLTDEARRALRGPTTRPPSTDDARLDVWLARLAGPADAAAGERLFFHPTVAACSRCHEYEGRGARIGPDLTTLAGTFNARRLIESILEPSREVAPHFVPWIIETDDGRALAGMYVGEELDGTIRYVDVAGKEFRLKPNQIERRTPSPKSIMPEGMLGQLTDQELRDLAAFLLKGV